MSGTITGTGISAVTTADGLTRTLHYQLLDGKVREKKLGAVRGTTPLTASVITTSPLASITWAVGDPPNQVTVIHVYYLDSAHVLHDYCWSSNTRWTQGHIHYMHIKVNPEAGVAATSASAQDIRVYYQEEGSLLIRGVHYTKEHGWRREHLQFGGALSGTNIAAVTNNRVQPAQVHLYYQTQDLSLIERIQNGSKWTEGTLTSGPALARTPICAAVTGSGKFYAFWRNRWSLVEFAQRYGNPSWSVGELPDPVVTGYQLAMVQWEDGVKIRLYCQNSDGSVQEIGSPDSGANWALTELVEAPSPRGDN